MKIAYIFSNKECVDLTLSIDDRCRRNAAGYRWNRCVDDLTAYKNAVMFGDLDIAALAMEDLHNDLLRWAQVVGLDDSFDDDAIDNVMTLASSLIYDHMDA